MSIDKIREIPEPDYFISQLPVPEALKQVKAGRDRVIKDVLAGRDKRLLLIIGPCSADNENAVCEYVSRLGLLQEAVEERLVIIPRIYTNKPRTNGDGYKGMLHQPNPEADPDIFEGIRAIRRMHIRALSESHLCAADEMLYPENYAYLEDVLSYVAIGARSCENQQHRLVCSGLDVPVGVKNPTSGDISVMMNSIYAVQRPHQFKYHNYEVRTSGNEYGHGVLRGAVDYTGKNIPNYHYENLVGVAMQYKKLALKNPAIIIDTNHSNSGKHAEQQPRIINETLHNMRYSDELKSIIRGFMVESYLEPGACDIHKSVYGKSITDPCLGWEETEKLILNIADRL